jgi:hypothetical protein
LAGTGYSWTVELGERAAMAAGRLGARPPGGSGALNRHGLARDDRMTAKMPTWYDSVSAGARDRGRTDGPLGARVRRGRRATRGTGRK